MTWQQAEQEVRRIAGDLPIYWGSGGPIYKPHVCATTKDAWSGAGMGYDVRIARNGDGYGEKYEFHSVPVCVWKHEQPPEPARGFNLRRR